MVTHNTDNQYDDLNRLTSATNNTYSPAKILGYAYYEDGTRNAMTDTANAIAVTYTYDKAKRLWVVKRNGSTIGTYLYNALGLRTRLTFGNYAWVEYGYHTTTRWLTSVINKRWTAHNIIASSFTYTHDKAGNRKTMTLFGGDVVTYTYNAVYQLTNEVRTGSTPYALSWVYDSVGNRLTQTKSGIVTSYQYNDANQMISDTALGLTTIYEFDNNGNMIQKSNGTNTWVWGYDFENRQVTYTDPITSANNAAYTYDAIGRRIAKTVNGVVERYILDGADTICDYDGSNNLTASYVTPLLDDNLLVVKGTVKYYYMHDGLGNIRNLLRSSDQYVSNRYDYNAFGESLSQTEGVNNRYRFTGREWDGESSTYHYRARQYNPYSGRFSRRDPIGYLGGVNIYSYCGNNPVNYVDQMGLVAIVVNWQSMDNFREGSRSEENQKVVDQGGVVYGGVSPYEPNKRMIGANLQVTSDFDPTLNRSYVTEEIYKMKYMVGDEHRSQFVARAKLAKKPNFTVTIDIYLPGKGDPQNDTTKLHENIHLWTTRVTALKYFGDLENDLADDDAYGSSDTSYPDAEKKAIDKLRAQTFEKINETKDKAAKMINAANFAWEESRGVDRDLMHSLIQTFMPMVRENLGQDNTDFSKVKDALYRTKDRAKVLSWGTPPGA